MLKPLEADTSTLNFSAFAGVDRAELELADLQDKDMWSSKFRGLATKLENLERHRSTLALQHRWTEMHDLKKQDQIVFEVWNSLPQTYSNMKRYEFDILSIFGSTSRSRFTELTEASVFKYEFHKKHTEKPIERGEFKVLLENENDSVLSKHRTTLQRNSTAEITLN